MGLKKKNHFLMMGPPLMAHCTDPIMETMEIFQFFTIIISQLLSVAWPIRWNGLDYCCGGICRDQLV